MQYNYPSYIIHAGEERENHKYVARVRLHTMNGKPSWRYFYTNEEWQAFKNGHKKATPTNTGPKLEKANSKNPLFAIRRGIKSMSDQTKQKVDSFFTNVGIDLETKIKTGAEKTTETLNKTIDTVKKVASDIYDDKDNIYDVNTSNYDEKIKKIAETPEWKAIVAREDPEYVRKNSDGTNTYLIDDYLAKKKKPLLDVVDDIINNRPITVNEIDKDAMTASLKGQIFGKISIGILAAGAVSKALLEKTKLSQGSYNDEIENLKTTIDAGKDYISKTVEDAKVAKSVAESAANDPDVQEVMRYIENTSAVDTVKAAKQSVDEQKIIEAAKIIMQSDSIPKDVKENDYFKFTEASLSNLSEEEIVMLNVLIASIMKQK